GAPPRRWFVAGVTFALAVLAREVTLLFAPFLALWMVGRRAPVRYFIAGAVLGLAPLVARNLAVGAPPWGLSSRTLEVLVIGHAAGGAPAGLVYPPGMKSILVQADGRLWEAIRLTLGSYAGDWASLVRREAAKLAAVFSSYEAMDNVNWY